MSTDLEEPPESWMLRAGTCWQMVQRLGKKGKLFHGQNTVFFLHSFGFYFLSCLQLDVLARGARDGRPGAAGRCIAWLHPPRRVSGAGTEPPYNSNMTHIMHLED